MAIDNSMNPIVGDEWDPKTIPDQTGKVALVTGAYSAESIGFNIGVQLAIKGATVYLGARSLEKAQDGVKEAIKKAPEIKGRVHPFVTDLGDLKQTYNAAKEFAASQSRLDILVNNAALLIAPFAKDQYGYSHSFTINHLGPHVLTTTLLPLLKKTAAQPSSDVRVIYVSSVASVWLDHADVAFASDEAFKIDWESLATKELDGSWLRYGYSKLGNVLSAKELQRRSDAESWNIIAASVHPGGVSTTGAVKVAKEIGREELLTNAFTPLQGALTGLFAVTSADVRADKKKYGGQYLVPWGAVSLDHLSTHGSNAQLATELWNTSDKALSKIIAV